MQAAELTIDVDTAKEKLAHYRDALKRRHDDMDARLMRAFKAASKGLRVIDVNASILNAGFDENGLPRLAIARAGLDYVHYKSTDSITADFCSGLDGWGWPRTGRYWRVQIRGDVVRPKVDPWKYRRAMIPIVPPEFRPRFKLTNYHVLFEAEWEPYVAPVDPYLLKHIGGNLYAVLAEWDLTEIERAVMVETIR